MRQTRILKKTGHYQDTRAVMAIRRGFSLIIPLVLIAAFGSLLNNFPLPQFHYLMKRIFGPDWLKFGHFLQAGTINILPIALLIGISYSYAQLESPLSSTRINPTLTAIVSLISFYSYAFASDDYLTFLIIGHLGDFTIIPIALLSSALFTYLVKLQTFSLKTNVNAQDSSIIIFASTLIPAFLTVCTFICLRVFLSLIHIQSISDMVCSLFEKRVNTSSSLLGDSLYFILLIHFFEFFGMHPTQLPETMYRQFFSFADMSQSTAEGSHSIMMFADNFFDTFVFLGGKGAILSLVVAILLFQTKRRSRIIRPTWFSPAFFNIGDSILYSIPVILNHYFFIPFLLTPLLFTLTSWFAFSYGLVAPIQNTVVWTTPILISGYQATGSLAGSFLQLFNLALGVLIYLPFVKMEDNNYITRCKASLDTLVAESCTSDPVNHEHFINRTDAVGEFARQLSQDLKMSMNKTQYLFMEYQPKLNYEGRVVGVESLLRWQHSLWGSIPPYVAITLAEENNLIITLGNAIFRQVCRQQKIWADQGLADLSIAINISPHQIQSAVVIPEFLRIIKETGADPTQMVIEFPEQMSFHQTKEALLMTEKLRELGMKIAIDDFGMGHTSLLILHFLNVDEVKLDGSLIHDIATNEKSRNIISSIVHLGQSCYFSVVAEYVETEEQKEALHELGCNLYQGWLYSKALPAEDIPTYCINHC